MKFYELGSQQFIRISFCIFYSLIIFASHLGDAQAKLDFIKDKKKVVLIERQIRPSFPPAVGSGFFVTPFGHILTAAHVISNAGESDEDLRDRTVTVSLRDGTRRIGRTIRINRLLDLAVVKIQPEAPTPYFPMGSSREIRVGDTLTVIGHPVTRARWEISSGNVERITSTERIHLRATLVPGHSGAPALDENGNVVGVASYRINAAEQSYLVPIDDAKSFLSGIVAVAGATGTAPKQLAALSYKPSNFGFEFKDWRVSVISVRPLQTKDVMLSLGFQNKSEKHLYLSLDPRTAAKHLLYSYPTYLIDENNNQYKLKSTNGIGGRDKGHTPLNLARDSKRTATLNFSPVDLGIRTAGKIFSFSSDIAVLATDNSGKPARDRSGFLVPNEVVNVLINDIKAR